MLILTSIIVWYIMSGVVRAVLGSVDPEWNEYGVWPLQKVEHRHDDADILKRKRQSAAPEHARSYRSVSFYLKSEVRSGNTPPAGQR